jgi:DNA-binding PucR family transcriptional regulator
LTLTNEEIVEWIESFDKDAKAIKKELFSICWYMRGSITYDDAVMLSYEDRTMISKLIKDNLEVTKESGLPFF